MLYRTYQPKAKDIKRGRHIIDARGEILGRLASGVAQLLIGKHKKTYSSHLDSGDWVTVVNAKEVRVTGKKEKQKVYYRHSGYPGGLKALRLEEIREKNPARIVEFAVKNMLPKNRLRKRRMARLKVFAGEEHSYRNKFEARSTKSETNFKA